jgi:DNA polymerase-3 subunit alpha
MVVRNQNKLKPIQKKNSEKMEAPAKNETVKDLSPLILRINADHVKLSHFLKLKNIFENHRGNIPVHLDFFFESYSFATIHVDSKWGVIKSPSLKEAILAISSAIEYMG